MRATLEATAGPVTSLRVTLGKRAGIVARLRAFRARPATDQEKRLAGGREERLKRDQEHAARLQSYPSISTASVQKDHGGHVGC